MGLETEKADVQLFMDEEAYSHHGGVDYADPEKFVDSGHDRDPHRINSHLQVRLGRASTWAVPARPSNADVPPPIPPHLCHGVPPTLPRSHRHQPPCVARNS
jgi:hypothetical protein